MQQLQQITKEQLLYPKTNLDVELLSNTTFTYINELFSIILDMNKNKNKPFDAHFFDIIISLVNINDSLPILLFKLSKSVSDTKTVEELSEVIFDAIDNAKQFFVIHSPLSNHGAVIIWDKIISKLETGVDISDELEILSQNKVRKLNKRKKYAKPNSN